MKSLFNKKSNIMLFGAYILVMLPMCYAIWFSVPASDDFAFGINSISDNIIANAWGYSLFCYGHHSGRWLTFFVQKIINPLNLHVHLGHWYGVYMIVFFIITTAIIIYSIRTIVGKLIDGIRADIVTLLILAVFYTTNYYSEVFNWYVGGTAYALPVALLLLSMSFTVRYIDTHEKRYYVGLILAGILPATNEFLDVPIGIGYLFLAFYLDRETMLKNDKAERSKAIAKQLMPLIIFIICGLSVVLAPGNWGRQESYAVTSSLTGGLTQTIIDILVRVKELFFTHSWSLILYIGIFLLGFLDKREEKVSPLTAILAVLTLAIATFGGLFPYVYGRAFTNTYVDVRMEYVLEVLMELTIAIAAIMLGKLLQGLISQRGIYALSLVVVIGALALMVRANSFTSIVQVDIVRHSDLLQESYAMWDGIIAEIEQSSEDDVVIHRDKEPEWSPYFLYMGITEGDDFDLDMDTIYSFESIMPNVYYGKKSITLYYDNH